MAHYHYSLRTRSKTTHHFNHITVIVVLLSPAISKLPLLFTPLWAYIIQQRDFILSRIIAIFIPHERPSQDKLFCCYIGKSVGGAYPFFALFFSNASSSSIFLA